MCYLRQAYSYLLNYLANGRYIEWHSISGNEKLLKLPLKSLFRKKQICFEHFLLGDFINPVKSIKSTKLAVPIRDNRTEPCSSIRSPSYLRLLTPKKCYIASHDVRFYKSSSKDKSCYDSIV